MRRLWGLVFVLALILASSGCQVDRACERGQQGVQGNATSSEPVLSGDGRFVAFLSDASNLVPGDTNGIADVFVRDNRTGAIERIAGSDSVYGMSEDGRYVAVFDAGRVCQLPGGTNVGGLFIHDRQADTFECVWLTRVQDAALSATGRFVAFTSGSTGCCFVGFYDREADQYESVPVPVVPDQLGHVG